MPPSFVSVWEHRYANIHLQKSQTQLLHSMWIPLRRIYCFGVFFVLCVSLGVVMGVTFSVGKNDKLLLVLFFLINMSANGT